MEFNPLPILLAAVGGFLLFKLRFFFILHPIRTLGRTLRTVKDGRAMRSFMLALAGTLGIGNVFGVAVGLIIGGPGSLFWLLVSMVFAMVIKYSEVVLTADNLFHDTESHGGMFYVIRSSFSRYGNLLSRLYSLAVLLLSFVLGAALQMATVYESVVEFIGIPPWIFAIIAVFICFIFIAGGTAKIEKITSILIPLTTIIYIIVDLIIIFANFENLPSVISAVVSSAFKAESAVGGMVGFLLLPSVREGFARGILSNEAGAGTSSIAHARSGILSPSSAGLLGILEVWFDTGLICMLTGFSILLSVKDVSAFEGGMQLVLYSVGNLLGVPGKLTVFTCVISFAFATVICWYYYGLESWCSLFKKKSRALFLPVFLLAVFLGFFIDSYLLIRCTDAFMLCATLLTVLVLIKNSDRLRRLSESGGVIDSEALRLRPFRKGHIKGNVFSREEKHR